VVGGTTPQLDAVLQAGIENGYRQFLTRVSAARNMPVPRVDQIAQGRVWDGGTARQIGLVDRFGGLSDAIAEAARRARLDPAKVRPVFLEQEPNWWAELAAGFAEDEEESAAPAGDVFAQVAAMQRDLVARALGDMRRLAAGGSIQARCLECGGLGAASPAPGDARLLGWVLARLGL
jgi:protease IV